MEKVRFTAQESAIMNFAGNPWFLPVILAASSLGAGVLGYVIGLVAWIFPDSWTGATPPLLPLLFLAIAGILIFGGILCMLAAFILAVVVLARRKWLARRIQPS